MPRKTPQAIQQYRGTTEQHATYTGLIGELTVDTDKKVVVVQDGATAGGIPMAREDRKVAGDNYIKVNGAAEGTLAADLTLTMDMTKVAADLVSADENNGLSVGTDNKLFAKAPDADLILRPGDKILHDVDGKVAADISVSYDQPSGVLNIIGHDGSTVVATATIPSSTSILKGVELVEGKPSADGEEVKGDYHVSLRVAYKKGGAQKYSDAAGVTFTATKGTESAGVAMPEFTVPEDATDQKYEAVFMGQEAEQAVAATAAFAFTDGSTMRLAEGMLYFTPQIGIEAGIYLHFIFVLSDSTLADLYIDVTDLVDVYTAGQGITITGKEISAKLGVDGGVKFDESGNIVVDFTNVISTDADNALKEGADGKLSVTVVSADEGNLIKTGSDKGALLTKDYITDAEQARDDAKEYAKKAAASAKEAADTAAEIPAAVEAGIERIEKAGASQIAAVENAGSEQIAAVEAEGKAQTAAAKKQADAAAASSVHAGDSATAAGQSAQDAAASAGQAATSATDAGTSASSAAQSSAKARAWAENAEDTPVEAGGYSALHWAAKSRNAALTVLAVIPLIEAGDDGKALVADGKTLTWVKGPSFTETPAAGAVPKADASGKLNAWVDVPTPWSPGDIKMWFGELDATGKYPLINGVANTSWHICDGTGGTPDMRDRVPVGASASKAKGTTGGSETHDHAVSVTIARHAATSITGSVASAYSGVSSSTASASISGTVSSTTLSMSQMPSHSHKLEERDGAISSGSLGAYGVLIPDTSARSTYATGSSESHTHGFSGGSHSHSISESEHSHSAGTLKTPVLSHTASGDAADASTLQPYVALHFLMYVG